MNDKALLVIHLFGRKCKMSRIGKLHLTAVGLKCGLMADGREYDIGQFCEVFV